MSRCSPRRRNSCNPTGPAAMCSIRAFPGASASKCSRIGRRKCPAADHLHRRLWRQPDAGASDEGGCRRGPDVPRSGSARRCRGSARKKPRPAGRREAACQIALTLRDADRPRAPGCSSSPASSRSRLPAISAVSEMTVNMHRRQFMRKSSSASTARSQPEPR